MGRAQAAARQGLAARERQAFPRIQRRPRRSAWFGRRPGDIEWRQLPWWSKRGWPVCGWRFPWRQPGRPAEWRFPGRRRRRPDGQRQSRRRFPGFRRWPGGRQPQSYARFPIRGKWQPGPDGRPERRRQLRRGLAGREPQSPRSQRPEQPHVDQRRRLRQRRPQRQRPGLRRRPRLANEALPAIGAAAGSDSLARAGATPSPDPAPSSDHRRSRLGDLRRVPGKRCRAVSVAPGYSGLGHHPRPGAPIRCCKTSG